MIYFTADLHFGHKNIIKYCDRPFEDEIEMDKTIISNWNSVVKDQDTVYVIGDFTKLCDCKTINNYLKQLNGKINLLLGNHDEYIRDNLAFLNFNEVYDYKEIVIANQKVILFHYPIFEWNDKKNGAICLHGHTHSKSKTSFNIPNLYDVGVDANNFYPVLLDKILI